MDNDIADLGSKDSGAGFFEPLRCINQLGRRGGRQLSQLWRVVVWQAQHLVADVLAVVVVQCCRLRQLQSAKTGVSGGSGFAGKYTHSLKQSYLTLYLLQNTKTHLPNVYIADAAGSSSPQASGCRNDQIAPTLKADESHKRTALPHLACLQAALHLHGLLGKTEL